MARKMNQLRIAQQVRGESVAAGRRNAPPVATLYLAQLRAQTLKVSPFKRQVQIAISVETAPEFPQDIKIIQTDLK
jgi:hypothetical protein